MHNDQAKREFEKIKEIEKTIDREKLVYRASRDIYEGKITLEEANEDQKNLLRDIKNLKNRARP